MSNIDELTREEGQVFGEVGQRNKPDDKDDLQPKEVVAKNGFEAIIKQVVKKQLEDIVKSREVRGNWRQHDDDDEDDDSTVEYDPDEEDLN